MCVVGIGTDIIECERISRMLLRHRDNFVRMVFTELENQYCSDRKNSSQHYAGRWAAKEAVMKALGTGWVAGLAWTDIEVVNQSGGKPIINLHNGATKIANQLGIIEIQISITHCESHAVAFAIALGNRKS
ncbi:MAG: holo-ACP synthase [Planctomycetaceae bacterium]|nr:holo-ACP synthase [Planctomycetaceae bacterium]